MINYRTIQAFKVSYFFTTKLKPFACADPEVGGGGGGGKTVSDPAWSEAGPTLV